MTGTKWRMPDTMSGTSQIFISGAKFGSQKKFFERSTFSKHLAKFPIDLKSIKNNLISLFTKNHQKSLKSDRNDCFFQKINAIQRGLGLTYPSLHWLTLRETRVTEHE